jgi:hypothetical protein
MITDERPDGDDETDWNAAWRQFSKTDGSAILTSPTDAEDMLDTLPSTDDEELTGGEDFLTYSVNEGELDEDAEMSIDEQILHLTNKYREIDNVEAPDTRPQLPKMEPKSGKPIKTIAEFKAEREGRMAPKPAASSGTDVAQDSPVRVSTTQVVSAGLSVSLSAYVYIMRPALAVAAPATGAAFGLGLYAAVGLVATAARRIFAAAPA